MIFSRKEDGICEYKNEVRTSRLKFKKPSIELRQSPRETTPKFWKTRGNLTKRGTRIRDLEIYILKKRLQSLNKEKSKKNITELLQIVDSSDEEKDEPYYHGSKASTTLTREQALKLSLRKIIDERKLNK